MNKRSDQLKKAESDKPKKEFKIEIVKIGKLDEYTGGRHHHRNTVQTTNSQNSYFPPK